MLLGLAFQISSSFKIRVWCLISSSQKILSQQSRMEFNIVPDVKKKSIDDSKSADKAFLSHTEIQSQEPTNVNKLFHQPCDGLSVQ